MAPTRSTFPAPSRLKATVDQSRLWVAEPKKHSVPPPYKFDLARGTDVDPDRHEVLADSVREYLADAGYAYEGMELGTAESGSSDVIVRQGDFSLLMVTFVTSGGVLVSATTPCWPGDRDELSDLMFGGVNLSEGYLPRMESPSDPLFFGVTPGEPAFGPTPKPTDAR